MQSSDVIEIDGSIGEGGGQILRSSLTLSLVTGRTCRLTRIRAGRRKPGLLHQHLAAVQAAADVGAATVEGAALGSQDIFFEPTTVRGGSGGTHSPFAPPFDFLQFVLLPILRRMGARLRAHLVRPGFFPAGGGELRVTVEPVPRLEPHHAPTPHTLTNIEILQMFVDVSVSVRQEDENVWIVAIDRAAPHAPMRT